MYHEVLPTEVPPLRQSFAAGSLIMVCALGGYSAVGSATSELSRQQQCAAPSADALEKVTTMFDSPRPEPDASAVATLGTRRAYQEFSTRRKAELGITFPQYDTMHLDELEINLNQGKGDFNDYYSVLEGILGQMDIPLKIGPVKGMDREAQTPTNEELQTYQAMFQTLRLARMFGQTPMNLTKRLGITQVALTAHGEGFGGLTLIDNGVLIIDVTNNGKDRFGVTEHEYEHLVDVAECGPNGIRNDPAYTSLNRLAGYAGAYPLPENFLSTVPPSMEALSERIYKLQDSINAAVKAGDTQKACQEQATLAALKSEIEAESNYSYSEVAEDKAELGLNIFDPSYYEALDTRSPVRRAKFLLLLARLDELAPEVVEYYSLEAVRPLQPTDWCVVPLKKTGE